MRQIVINVAALAALTGGVASAGELEDRIAHARSAAPASRLSHISTSFLQMDIIVILLYYSIAPSFVVESFYFL